MAEDKGPLLGELEELKAVLRKQREVDLSAIPLLNDIIEDEPSLELAPAMQPEADTIYDDEDHGLTDNPVLNSSNDAEYAQLRPTFDHQYSDDGNYEREILMQEVIDSMMPEIEAQLRKRLLNLDESTLARWYSQLHSDN